MSKLETGVRPPDASTLERYLRAVGANLHDLADALDVANARTPPPRNGRPRPEWVGALTLRGIERDVLWGFAMGAFDRSDPDGEADFVESVRTAAAQLAERAIQEAKRAREPASMVAEPPPEDEPR